MPRTPQWTQVQGPRFGEAMLQGRKAASNIAAQDMRTNALGQQMEDQKRARAQAEQLQSLMSQLDFSAPLEAQQEIVSQLPQETQMKLMEFYGTTPADVRARKQQVRDASNQFILNTYGNVKDQDSWNAMRAYMPRYFADQGFSEEEFAGVVQAVPEMYDPVVTEMAYNAAGGAQNALKGGVKLGPEDVLIGAGGQELARGVGKPEKWGTPYKVVEDGVTRLKRRSSTGQVQDLGEGTKPTGTTINLGGKGPLEAIKPILQKMPAMQQEAKSAAKNIERIDQALALAEKHGDDITGWSGGFKRLMAKPAKAIGLDIQAMNDAEIFHSLLTEGQGALRMQVVGPGPVSEYEQKILEAVSGKRMSAAEGIKLILERSRNAQISTIDTYNDHISALSSVDGMEVVGKLYKPVEVKEMEQTAPAGATHGGVNPATGEMEYFDAQGNRVR